MIALYTVGLPVGVFLILWHRRHKLYGSNSERTRVSWGFLYESYGASAWFWEVQEMLRKLFLTSFVVVLSAHSPLQVTQAVLVSFWAHTLHSLYEPWGYGSQTYILQHLSLAATSFMFLMGLLFKSGRVDSTSIIGLLLSCVMLALAAIFMICWIWVMLRAVMIGYRAERRMKAMASAKSAATEFGGMHCERPGSAHWQ
jgi:hypothetical protein